MDIMINDRCIYYQIRYTKASKMNLVISREGHITVEAPVKTPKWEIEKLIQKNKNRISKIYDAIENRQYISSHKTYEEDENFLFLGQACKLSDIFKDGKRPETKEGIELALKKFYTKETKKIVSKRVKYYEKIIGVTAKSFAIVEDNGTWGTCNNLRELTFNYRLSMAPLTSIDYVVIHELCHIYHMNHDRSFWRKVGGYDKDYKEHAAFFEKYGAVMTV